MTRDIYAVPNGRRHWVVRAEGGYYYDHFIKHGIMALGHLDALRLPASEGKPYTPKEEDLKETLTKLHGSSREEKRRASVHLRQAKAFITEMNIGDWVLTVGDSVIHYGRIIGHPVLDKTPLPISYPRTGGRYEVVNLEYNLRRKVQWGPSIEREKLPFGLLSSFQANQTLFNIDSHWDAIYHTLYPVFTKDNNLYLSAKINTDEKINNYNLVGFLGFLNEIEVIAKEFNPEKGITNIDSLFNDYAENSKFTVTTKAEFHSPGDIWNVIAGLDNSLGGWSVNAVIIYSMLFGNQKLGFDGLLDLKTRQKLWDIVIKRIEKNKISSIINNLKITAPNKDTTTLEDESNDEK